MKILVFMYDNRMDIVRDRFLEEGYEVVEGNNQADMNHIAKASNTFDGVILPIQGVEDNGQIKMKGELYDANEFFLNLSSQCIIFAGVKRNYLDTLNNKVIYLFSEEEIMVPNAMLAAEGLLLQMIEYTDKSIFEYQIDIIGHGHVGKACMDLLTRLKIWVNMILTQPQKSNCNPIKVINRQNVRFQTLEEWKKRDPADIIIITAPIEIINEKTSKGWEKKPLVIDMAKGRHGVSDNAANSGKMVVIKAPALPALAAPKTAGMILADYMISVMNKQTK